jgi:uncharacterized repeat protein (TIGR01451 family)
MRNSAPRIWPCGRLFLAVFALWALTSALVARAGDNTWSPIGPDGGYISKVAFHKNLQNTMYLRASGGFFRSSDGGVHWQQPQPEITIFASDFAVDPSNNNRIYLVLNSGRSRVLVSYDAGATFITLAWLGKNDSTPTHIAVSADGNTLYAVFYDGSVFRSTDRGSSWQQRTSIAAFNLSSNVASIDPTDANTLYVVRNDRVLVTNDGAGTWADVSPASGGVEDLAINPTDPNELWAASRSELSHSTNRGASWSRVQTGYISSVALDPRAPSTVYATESWGNVLKRSGGTWSDITNDLGSFAPRAIAVSPHNSATIALANVRGLWMTSNGGGSWARRDAGVASTSISGFAVASDRVYTKGGAVTRLDHGADTATEIDMDSLFQLLSYKTSGIGALAPVLESGSGLIVAVGPHIARTLDDGATWNLTGYSIPANDAVYDLAATASAPSVYYASSSSTLQRSIDQGATWTTIGTGLPAGQSPGSIAIAPSNPSVIYVGPRSSGYFGIPASGVYKSTDGGGSFTPANTGIEDRFVRAIAVHPTNPDIVYIGTLYYLRKTVDGGATWTELPWPGQRDSEVLAIAIDPRAPETVYVAGSQTASAVARSTDGGATWTSLAEPNTFFPWRPSALAIDPTRPDTLRVGTGFGGIRQMSLRPELQPDLAIAMTSGILQPPLLVPSEYHFTIRNLAPGPTGNVIAKFRLNAEEGAQVSVGPSAGSCVTSGYVIDCEAPPLAANATLQIVVTVIPTRTSPIEITGAVYTDRVDAQLSNNTVSRFVAPVELARFDVNIAGPTTVQVGDSVQYIATITNRGPSPASGVVVTFSTPPGFTRGSFSITTGTCADRGSLVCEIGAMAFGATLTLTVNGTIAQPGTYQVHSSAGYAYGSGGDAWLSTNASFPPAPQPPPSNGGGSSGGGGGGGGSTSPLMLLGLLVLGLLRAQQLPARRSAGRRTVCR